MYININIKTQYSKCSFFINISNYALYVISVAFQILYSISLKHNLSLTLLSHSSDIRKKDPVHQS